MLAHHGLTLAKTVAMAYGFAFKQDLKSLVWYSPEQFEDNGYEIPTTMEALIELSDQMVADGNTPGVSALNQVMQQAGQQQTGWKI